MLEVIKEHDTTSEEIAVGLTERDLAFLEFPVGHRVLLRRAMEKRFKIKKGSILQHVATAPYIGGCLSITQLAVPKFIRELGRVSNFN